MKFLKNFFLVTIPALLVFVLLLELTARFILPTSDFPDIVFHAVYGNQFAPNQSGTYISGEDQQIKGRFRINAQGWNSPYDYEQQKPPGTFRIAVIGDSYVEALQVDFDKSFPYLLEKKLSKKNPQKRLQSYSFGHTGANLAQNLVVFKNASQLYRPDLAVLFLIHNDFLESFEGHGRVDNSTLRLEGGSYVLVPPRPADTMQMKRLFRNSALVRYLVVNHRVLEKIRFIRNWYYGDTRKVDANVSLEKAETFSEEQFRKMLAYTFGEFKKQAEKTGTQLLFVINTPRFPEDVATHGEKSAMSRFNRMSKEAADALGIPFMDLTPVFQESWKKNGQRHKWVIDSHWNANGHEVVSEVLSRRIQQEFLPAGK